METTSEPSSEEKENTSIEDIIGRNLNLMGISSEINTQNTEAAQTEADREYAAQLEDVLMDELTIQSITQSITTHATNENTPSDEDSPVPSIAGGGTSGGAAGNDRMQSDEKDEENSKLQLNNEDAERDQEDQ